MGEHAAILTQKAIELLRDNENCIDDNLLMLGIKSPATVRTVKELNIYDNKYFFSSTNSDCTKALTRSFYKRI